MTKEESIYKTVSKIPKGKVLTYKLVAQLSGIKNPRLVGSILHKNPDPIKVPCHRVVNSKGEVAQKFAFGGAEGQKSKLKKEGVKIEKKVNLRRYIWEKHADF